MNKHSYSSLSKYLECARAWKHQYVLRDLPRVSSPQLLRGREVHKTLETAVKTGVPPMSVWTPPGFVEALHHAGAQAEHWMAMDWDGKPTSPSNPEAMLIGATDIRLAVKSIVFFGDWKTGKSPASPLQADAYATLERAVTPGIPVEFVPIYVDQKKVAAPMVPDIYASDRVFDLINRAESETRYEPRRGPGCYYCAVHYCEYKGHRA